MSLTLSDADLARLRLECIKACMDRVEPYRSAIADALVDWCLRDRPVEPEET